MKTDIKLINNFYVSRMIDSLEQDYKNWKCITFCGMDGSWYEYRSPDYTNQSDKNK